MSIERRIIINPTPKGDYKLLVVTQSTMKQCIMNIESVKNDIGSQRFKEKWGFRPEHLLLWGDSDICKDAENVKSGIYKTLKEILPTPTNVKNIKTKRIEPSYKCFCGEYNKLDVSGHNTPLSAWECLMARVGKPKYVMVVFYPIDNPDVE